MIHHHLSPTNKNQDILPPYHKWCVWTLGPPTEFGAIRNAEFRLGSYSPSRFFHWRACIPKSQSHKKFHWKTKTVGFYEPTKERSVEHVEHFHCKKIVHMCNLFKLLSLRVSVLGMWSNLQRHGSSTEQHHSLLAIPRVEQEKLKEQCKIPISPDVS